jgi:hypothetical protein
VLAEQLRLLLLDWLRVVIGSLSKGPIATHAPPVCDRALSTPIHLLMPRLLLKVLISNLHMLELLLKFLLILPKQMQEVQLVNCHQLCLHFSLCTLLVLRMRLSLLINRANTTPTPAPTTSIIISSSSSWIPCCNP